VLLILGFVFFVTKPAICNDSYGCEYKPNLIQVKAQLKCSKECETRDENNTCVSYRDIFCIVDKCKDLKSEKLYELKDYSDETCGTRMVIVVFTLWGLAVICGAAGIVIHCITRDRI